MSVYEQISRRDGNLAVVGLGYVGLPLAVAFAGKARVIGYDKDPGKIAALRAGVDPTGEVGEQTLRRCSVHFTGDEEDLIKACVFLVAVPTPVNEDETPNLAPLIAASETIGRALKKAPPGALVIYESTVYPGVTSGVCLPVLERASGLRSGVDFKVGYSPERINPGDKLHRLENTDKLVAGMDEDSTKQAAKLYEMIVSAPVHRVSSIEVAEAAKVVENTQRDLNIAFVNELAMTFERMGIDTREVLAAAGTKWNFLPFVPGLVGGHCIGVDPYYLVYQAKKHGYYSELIATGRRINNAVAPFLAQQTLKLIIQAGLAPGSANVYILGLTFKEDCPDIRNSKVADLFAQLRSYGVSPKVADPVAEEQAARQIYGEDLVDLEQISAADCVILAVAHSEFKQIALGSLFRPQSRPEQRVVIDIKGALERDALTQAGYRYWRL